MPEVLIYRKRFAAIVAAIVSCAYLAGVSSTLLSHHGFGDLERREVILVALSPVVLWVFLHNWGQIRKPDPRFRLSDQGFEGPFGRVEWPDVLGATRSFRKAGRSSCWVIAISLRPGATIHPPSRHFARSPLHTVDDIRPDRVELVADGLGRKPDELVTLVLQSRVLVLGS